jgi:hypothetical protein
MRFLLVILIILIAGCAYPTTSTRTVDDRPSIAIQGAPRGAMLFVDGLNMGEAQQYNGKPKALLLETGTHVVEVRDQERTFLSEKVFLGSGTTKALSVIGAGSASK